MNRDRTRELLPHVGVSPPLAELLDAFVGDNDLATADDLRREAEDARSKKWVSFRDETLLPAARVGRQNVVLQVTGRKSWKFRDDWDMLEDVARGKGLAVEKLSRSRGPKGKGKGKPMLSFSWAGEGKGPVVERLQAAASIAQRHRIKTLWSKLFKRWLLPFADNAFNAVSVTDREVQTFFRSDDGPELEAIAKRKGIIYQCRSVQVRRGSKGRGKAVDAREHDFAWRRVTVEDVSILEDVHTALDLMKVTARARQRIWEGFCRSTLRPAAAVGKTCVILPWGAVLSTFYFLPSAAAQIQWGQHPLAVAAWPSRSEDFEELKELFKRFGASLMCGRRSIFAQEPPYSFQSTFQDNADIAKVLW